MNTDFIKGIIVPILTPVDKNEVIDEGKMRKQVDFVIDGGVSGILAFGSNGEFYMTEEDEMMKALKIMLNHASGRVPVYMGIGAISTKKCIRIAKAAAAAGADGISVLQPMFLNQQRRNCICILNALQMRFRIPQCCYIIIRDVPVIP